MLVASPIFLRIDRGSRVTQVRSSSRRGAGAAKVGPSSGPAQPADAEWSRLDAKAGKTSRDFYLDAAALPADGGGPRLVASLICVDATVDCPRRARKQAPTPRTTRFRPQRRRRGRAVFVQAKKAANRPAPDPLRRRSMARIGDGIGTFSLADWFDMEKPGRYSVLVPGSHRKTQKTRRGLRSRLP